jgi:hypothetical protein
VRSVSKEVTVKKQACGLLVAALMLALAIPALAKDQPNPKNKFPQRVVPTGGHTESAAVNNGTVILGVNDFGNIIDAASGIGLQYVPTAPGDALTPGCYCEGWGLGDVTTGLYGSASWANSPYDYNVTLVSFTSGASSATSVVDVAGIMRITHDFQPSGVTPYLYDATVTVQNISPNPVTPVYRRVMDWDIPPNPFSEYVTLQLGGATAVTYSSDDGFASVNPFNGPSWIGFQGEAVDNGPGDHGALFDFQFDPVAPGESIQFHIYYGAAGNEADALFALAAEQVRTYSLGQFGGDPTGGTPNTFIFGFTGVGEVVPLRLLSFSAE